MRADGPPGNRRAEDLPVLLRYQVKAPAFVRRVGTWAGGMGEASYSGGDEVSGRVPVVSFFASALLEIRRLRRGKSGKDGVTCGGGIGCHCWVLSFLFLCAHTTYVFGLYATYMSAFWYCGSKEGGSGVYGYGWAG